MFAGAYDALVWLITAGKASSLRRATLAAASLIPGDDVLDAGCGTGVLAVGARAVVGRRARVVGVDAASSMLRRARQRAARAGMAVEFMAGRVGRLPFPDRSFDVVIISFVLHNLPADQLVPTLVEAYRVLRDGGRVVVVDFVRATTAASRLQAHLMLHGRAAAHAPDLVESLRTAGFRAAARATSPIAAVAIASGSR